ncbi:hypothetical protein BJ166DRAFT_593311 [Pestalotiopsis sp. NC0098]|nr:hypothetical protein BJ166DRAFT_593311 [Pestalotiopsis sp. NC0098]
MIYLNPTASSLLASWLLISQPLAAAAAAITVPPPDTLICPPEISPSSGSLHSQAGNSNDSEAFIRACFYEHEEYKIWRYRDDQGLRIEPGGGVPGAPGVRETIEAWDAETQLWSPQWYDGEDVAVYVESEEQKPLAGDGWEEGEGGPCTKIVTKIDSRSEALTRARFRECTINPANCPESVKLKFWFVKCTIKQMSSLVVLLIQIAIGELAVRVVAGRGAGVWTELTWSHFAAQHPRIAAGQEVGDELFRAITRWDCGCELPLSRDPYLDMLDARYRMLLAVFLVARWVRRIIQRRYFESYLDLFAFGILAYLCRIF